MWLFLGDKTETLLCGDVTRRIPVGLREEQTEKGNDIEESIERWQLASHNNKSHRQKAHLVGGFTETKDYKSSAQNRIGFDDVHWWIT